MNSTQCQPEPEGPEAASGLKNPHRIVFFESGEHETIGNKVILRYDSGSIAGSDFMYTIGSNTVSFGLIVALAGDFYANWSIRAGDDEQISDYWSSNPERSIALALKVARKLSSDEGGYLSKLLSLMTEEKMEVEEAMEKGRDPAQVYNEIATKYDTKYTLATNTGYAWIALDNWDHFGPDAIKAYSAMHTAALRQAKLAYDTGTVPDLTEAYFLEAFAQHYLTDLFSAGHLRAPRRVLHWTIFGDNLPTIPNIEVYPADRCAQKMHNEDCANGLWVSNQRGESWAVYGDKQLWSAKSGQNFLQAVNAAQAGVMEIWNTRKTGSIPSVSDYNALKMTPILETLNKPTNFTPLFRWEASNPNILNFRSAVDQRSDAYAVAMSSKPSWQEWQGLLSKIAASGEDTNMYPFTMSFLSETGVWHIRKTGESDLIINQYGAVYSGDYGQCWSMKSQTVLPIPYVAGDLKWVTVNDLGNGIVSLVGRLTPPNVTTISARHVGLKITVKDNVPSMEDVWSATISDGNSIWTEGDTSYGKYSQDSTDKGMLKYWTKGPRRASKIELWTLNSAMDQPPVKQNLKWETNILNFMLAYQIQANDNYDTFIGYGYDTIKSAATWYFSYWSSGYAKQNLTVISDPDVTFPAQVLMSGKFGTDDNGSRLIRVFYGNSFPVPGHIRIDMLDPSRNFSTGKIQFSSPPQTQTFPITWDAYLVKDYLAWFLADVNGNNLLDLVGFAVTKKSKLLVVVFPALKNFTFDKPVVSQIELDPARGTLLNAAFMTPVVARCAQYTYPEKTGTGAPIISYAAILAFFDNYGILGARMLAPVSVSGTYQYEIKGQLPAIAGQMSSSLARTDEDWMGRGETSESVGFVFA